MLDELMYNADLFAPNAFLEEPGLLAAPPVGMNTHTQGAHQAGEVVDEQGALAAGDAYFGAWGATVGSHGPVGGVAVTGEVMYPSSGQTAMLGQVDNGTATLRPTGATLERQYTSSNSGNSSSYEQNGLDKDASAPPHPRIAELAGPAAHSKPPQRTNSGSKRANKRAETASQSREQSHETSDEEANGHCGLRKSTPHSTVEKARRDRLNNLIEALAELVPASDRKYASDAGVRRPKHVILSDAHALLRKLKSSAAAKGGAALDGQQDLASAQNKPQVPLPPARGAGSGMSSPRQQPGAQGLPQATTGPLEMAIPFNMSPACTGVLVEQRTGDGVDSSLAWRVTVTCRDRRGLLMDMATALAKLPLSVQAASLRTCQEGSKAQGAFDILVHDTSLTPDEVQCVMNAAMYAYLINQPDMDLEPVKQELNGPTCKRARC